jgi:putative membrane protein
VRTLVIRWAVIVIAVFLIAWGLPQIQVGDRPLISRPLITYNNDWVTLAIFSAVLALLNTFVRPILAFFAAPITCMTAGLFTIVINTAMFALAAAIVPGFQVADFWAALLGAIAVSVVSLVVNLVVNPR